MFYLDLQKQNPLVSKTPFTQHMLLKYFLRDHDILEDKIIN